MSVSNELRVSRIKGIHSRFLAAAEQYPTLCFIATFPLESAGWKWLRPLYAIKPDDKLVKRFPFSTFPATRDEEKTEEYEEWRMSTNEYTKKHDALWQYIVRHSARNHACDHFYFPVRPWECLERRWAARYLDREQDGYPGRLGRSSVVLFEELSNEALAEFGTHDPQPETGVDGFSDPWLSLMYEKDVWTLKEVELYPERLARLDPPWKFDFEVLRYLVGLSETNVFLDSARTIELLIEGDSDSSRPSVTIESDTATTVASPTTTNSTAEHSLTAKENKALDFIRSKGRAKGVLIARHIGIEPSTWSKHYVPKLRRHGLDNDKDGDGYFIKPEQDGAT